MVIVDARSEARIDRLRITACDRKLKNATAAVEEQVLSIARPIGSFNVLARMVDNPPIGRSNGDSFQRALDDGTLG